MGFQDELRGLGTQNDRHQRHSLDTANADEAASDILEQLKRNLKSAVANGRTQRAGILGTKRHAFVTTGFHIDKTLPSTPCQKSSTFEGEVSTYWVFHDVHEAKLVAKRMSELGKVDGIRVTVSEGLYGPCYHAAVTY